MTNQYPFEIGILPLMIFPETMKSAAAHEREIIGTMLPMEELSVFDLFFLDDEEIRRRERVHDRIVARSGDKM